MFLIKIETVRDRRYNKKKFLWLIRINYARVEENMVWRYDCVEENDNKLEY